MSLFLQTFKFYNEPFRGVIYMPLRWLIVPFAKIESFIPKSGLIIDLGCGEGVMATAIALASPQRKVLGLDTNPNKIKLAKNLTKNIPNLSFEKKDALAWLPSARAFILSDFLHHLPREKHHQLFANIYKALDARGVMVIKEIDSRDKFRSKISRLFDFLFYPGDRINFLDSQKLVTTLEKLGFKVEILKERKYFPGSTNLFICQK